MTKEQWTGLAKTVLALVLAVALVFGYDLGVIQPREASVALQAQASTSRAALGPYLEQLTVGKQLDVSGPATFTDDVTVDGTLTATDLVTSSTSLALTGALTVTGPSALNGGLTMDTSAFTVADTSGNMATAGKATIGTFLVLAKATVIAVTAAMAIVPTASFQPLTAAGVITNATLSTSGATAGELVRFVNNSSNSITIGEGSTAKTPSTSVALGQYDSAMFMFDGTYWIEMALSDN